MLTLHETSIYCKLDWQRYRRLIPAIARKMRDGSPLKYDRATLRKIAKEAGYNVYQHVGSPRDSKYVEQRKAIAAQFRNEYGSANGDKGNANPYFVGVFDTVVVLSRISSASGSRLGGFSFECNG